MQPITEKFIFKNPDGVDLAGRLDMPRLGPPQAYAVFAHCFSCSKDFAASRVVTAQLTAQGLGVLRFDFTGLGHSDGEFANSHFRANVADLIAAIDAMTAAGRAPALLVGHSLGGAAVLQAAALKPQIKAVATIAAPYEPEHVVARLEGDLAQIRADGHGPVQIAGRAFEISAAFLEGLKPEALDARLKTLDAALLVCHAPGDAMVSIDNATQIFVKAKHPKSFLSLDKSDHLLSKREDAAFVGATIGQWAKRYISLTPPQEPELSGQVVVQATGLGKFQQSVLVQDHSLVADEPKAVGGLDSGPAPYDLLLAALGTCTNMTLALYAERKGLSLHGVETVLSHSKIHARDCADCETSGGKIDEITREIRIDAPDLTADQRARLLEIADMCPVHRSLHSEVKIRTRDTL